MCFLHSVVAPLPQKQAASGEEGELGKWVVSGVRQVCRKRTQPSGENSPPTGLLGQLVKASRQLLVGPIIGSRGRKELTKQGF